MLCGNVDRLAEFTFWRFYTCDNILALQFEDEECKYALRNIKIITSDILFGGRAVLLYNLS